MRRLFRRRSRPTDVEARLAEHERRLNGLDDLLGSAPWRRNLLLPSPGVYARPSGDEFMRYSTCSAADFLHPRFLEISALLAIPFGFHRKLWEWVFAVHTASANGLARPGMSALGFGVGRNEPIAAVLARHGVSVTATDAPAEVGRAWTVAGQHAAGVESLAYEGVVERETFLRNVTYEECDMTDNPERLAGYDFAWSSCCLEHLGNLERGLAFVENSLATLKPGGVACHTTEFNLSSNGPTVESGETVVYRKRDLDALVERLRGRGHAIEDIRVAPDAHHLDAYVDTPPYAESPHLRLELAGYAVTSVGLVIRRGR